MLSLIDMSPTLERILVVENDPDISDVIARQALRPMGYDVSVASDASSAIRTAIQQPPDLIIANLNLPGLSGKDLLVALTSQGVNAPFLVLAEKGQEPNVVHAFRLGATDYLIWPARDAEVVSAVERVMKQVRERKERQLLDVQLKQTNQELQRRVRDLMAIFNIGRAVLSITDQRLLFDKLVESVVTVTEAEVSWLSLRDEKNKTFLLIAHRGLPEGWAKKLNQTLDDGVSALVALSGETLSLNGEPLKQFKAAALGKAVVVVPIRVQQEVIGMLSAARKVDRPFTRGEQTLLEAVADYASISLVNTRLFRALAQTAESAQAGEQRKYDRIESMRQEMQSHIQSLSYPLELMLTGRLGPFTPEQMQALRSMQAALKQLASAANQQVTRPVSKI